MTAAVERVEDADLLAGADPLIVGPEARGDVDKSGPLVRRDEIVQHDAVPTGARSRRVEGGAIRQIRERRPGKPGDDARGRREVPGDGRRGEHELLPVLGAYH